MFKIIRTTIKAYTAYRTMTAIKSKFTGKKQPSLLDDIKNLKRMLK